jgi:hypothetical protein
MPYFIRKISNGRSMFEWTEKTLNKAELADFKDVMKKVERIYQHYIDNGLIEIKSYREDAYSNTLNETICIITAEKVTVKEDKPLLPKEWKYWYERFTREMSTDPIEFSID